jgi:hypothetical protein
LGRDIFGARYYLDEGFFGRESFVARVFLGAGFLGRGFFGARDFGIERFWGREIFGARDFWGEVVLGRGIFAPLARLSFPLISLPSSHLLFPFLFPFLSTPLVFSHHVDPPSPCRQGPRYLLPLRRKSSRWWPNPRFCPRSPPPPPPIPLLLAPLPTHSHHYHHLHRREGLQLTWFLWLPLQGRNRRY